MNNPNPFQSIIDKMFNVIYSNDVNTKRLAIIISFALEGRDGLIEEPEECPQENIDWVNESILKYTEIIVRANHKAHRILNGDIVPESCEEEVREALEEISSKLITKK